VDPSHTKDISSVAGLSLRLLRNAVRFRGLKWTGRPGSPQAVSIEVTRRCIAKCKMCGIWRSPVSAPELSLTQWQEILSHPLLSDLRELDVTGGEPYLRDDLPAMISFVASLRRTNLSRLRSVAVTTNGLLTDRVLAASERMAGALARARLDLVIVCALDAVGPMHDQIRGVPGAWSRLEATLDGLDALRATAGNVILGIKTTVLPDNAGALVSIADYARARGLFTIISPFILTGGRYLNADLEQSLGFTPGQRSAMLEFYKSDGEGWDYHGRSLCEFLETGRMRRPCTCGFNYFFVRSTGELFLCPLLETPVGNVRDVDLRGLWEANEASRLRRGIGGYEECRRCTEPGLERYSLPYEGLAYLSLLPRLGARRFLRAHGHMGLDKYF
jgi:MoaA/NifB/PqqE/SkfB family radical SAM enzyme